MEGIIVNMKGKKNNIETMLTNKTENEIEMNREGKSQNIQEIVKKQKAFFETGKTKDISYRKEALKRLKQAIIEHEPEINQALKQDLNKSEMESYMTEIGMVLSELSHAIKHVKSWSKKKKVKTPLAQFHGSSYEMYEPYGVSLIIAPWNYPFMLAIDPLVGAIAAGNCCIIKTSEYAPATSKVIQKIISEQFKSEYIAVVEGAVEETTELINQKLDYIFFTGSVHIGKIIMQAATKNLTPVTLELGGKSPCIVEKTANLELAAKRILFGKILNAGQTCVAPDYILVQKEMKEPFVEELKKQITHFLGEDALKNEDYPKMIHTRQYERVKELIKNQKILFGGKWDDNTRKVEPTLLDEPDANSMVMQEEIFGPVLPIISFQEIEDAIEFVRKREKPLACYLFTSNKKVEKEILNQISFGGGCINDTIIHLASNYLGFGGVGQSGMGSYHGKKSFLTFSHEKSIVKKYTWIDLPMRYLPYSKAKLKMVKMFLK